LLEAFIARGRYAYPVHAMFMSMKSRNSWLYEAGTQETLSAYPNQKSQYCTLAMNAL